MRYFSHMVMMKVSPADYTQLVTKYYQTFFKINLLKNIILCQWMKEQFKNIQLFFFLPSTMDRKQKINKFQKNVSLHPINCRYKDFQKYSGIGVDFKPEDLDSSDLKKRSAAKEIVLNFFKNPAQASNWNLVRNANTLLTKGGTKINPDQKISWIEKSRKQQQDKYKFTY